MSNPHRSALAWALVSLAASSLSPACAKKTKDAADPAWTQSSSAPLPQRSTKANKKHDPAWGVCHQSFKPAGKSDEADVSAMAAGCAAVTKMKLVGSTITGKQDAENQLQTLPLKADAGKCYRVYAHGGAGVADLDLAIEDSNGDIVAQDTTDDPSPVIVEDGAVCFKVADAAKLIVSMGAGKGSYALQVWSD